MGPGHGMGTIAVYIHIPFCRARCTYCDFNTYAGIGHLYADYVAALETEIKAAGRLARDGDRLTARTIFFGGGTPTVLPLTRLEQILAAGRQAFAVDDSAEISSEANPGTVDREYLEGLRALGINRLSLGVQSFDPTMLRLLGRLHTADQAVETFRLAHEVGFGNVNLDLIYGLPYQTLDHWEETLQRALALGPEHLSAYALGLEEGTPLKEQVDRGQHPRPDPDLAADMYLLAEEMLADAGYRHYEISNWARPGRECRHNLTYWRNEPYLGFGAGAHSWFGGRRFWGVLSPEEYIQRVSGGLSTEGGGEEIGRELEMAETVILGLRLDEGVGLEDFAARFDRRLEELYKRELGELTELGLVKVSDGSPRLTQRGRLLANEVFERFLPEG